MTESKIAKMIFEKWLRSDVAAHNIHHFPFESDVLALKPSGMLIEYEIKLSVSDFRADAKKSCKDRFNTFSRYDFLLSGKGANKFYYVMPKDILDKVRDEIPDFAGIITVNKVGRSYKDLDTGQQVYYDIYRPCIVRKPKTLHSRKFDISEQLKTAMYWKAWNMI